jgi:hypothetical protein
MKRRTIVFIGSLGLGLLFFFFFIGQRDNSPKTSEEEMAPQQAHRVSPTPTQASNVLVIEKGPYAPKRISLQKGWNTIQIPAYTTGVISDPQGGKVSTPDGNTLRSTGKRFTQSGPEFRVHSERHGVSVYLYYEYKYKSSHYVKSQLGG